MATPNIINVATITPKVAVGAVTTSRADIIDVSAEFVAKVNSLIKIKGDKIFINGTETDKYTFKQDYYWMMGDNRGNSQDSRSWGFVPFDHVVGKPIFTWLSIDYNKKGLNKIRWDRMFTTIHGEGKPISFLFYFIGLIVLWKVISFIIKRRKKA